MRNSKKVKMFISEGPQFYQALKVPLDGGDSGLLGTGVGSGFLGTAIGTFSSGTTFLMVAGTLKILVQFSERKTCNEKSQIFYISKVLKE